MINDNVTVDRDPGHTELVALRNRMDAAEAAIAEAERCIVALQYSLCITQEFLLRHVTFNPGMGEK